MHEPPACPGTLLPPSLAGRSRSRALCTPGARRRPSSPRPAAPVTSGSSSGGRTATLGRSLADCCQVQVLSPCLKQNPGQVQVQLHSGVRSLQHIISQERVDLLHLFLFIRATRKATPSCAVPGGPGSLQDSRLAVGSGGLAHVGASGKSPEYAPPVDNSIGSQLAASVLSSEDMRHSLAGFSSASSLSIAQPGTAHSRS